MAIERAGSNIQITGVKQTVEALKVFAPEIQKRMNAQIRQALLKTRAGAQARYPKGSWAININAKKILGSISARGGGVRADSWAESSPGIRAAVFEFAGSQQKGRTPQARGMIASLDARYGSPGRFLWDAWDATGKGVMDDIASAVKQAESDLQRKLDSMGEGY